MTSRRTIALAAIAATATALAVTVAVRAAGDKVAFPEKFGVLYATVDRDDNKQYRELYASSQAAIDAAKAGKPLPNGTVLTLVQYAAQLDDKGIPVKDTNGRFIKTDKILGYTVMEKRTGWGVEYPDDIRNGEWEYQAFTAGRKPNPKANLANCFKCHKPLDKQDFVFSYDRMKSAMK
ncbi:MAG: cytochrome P460 family protein [Xanthobacteraceae bacterium]